jgi:hypothetical protein
MSYRREGRTSQRLIERLTLPRTGQFPVAPRRAVYLVRRDAAP